ncbi:FRG domain-containing protein [Mariniphaga sediminis]|uniref:FRG domain-containing protein n=1 Tax=Mariniphaga sediminis TaxID=1628158 RepID=A0A399D2T5_9BACT|nr:FRG domain-containing protein [Mariniphaga sediminis]RIH66194.1 FRG domain-containing protein [Mariniphaga sediminis]
MKLQEYSTLDEKEEFFINGKTKISVNITSIFKKLKEFETEGTNFIFRGCGEAKYRMYNSAQRVYITQELHKQVPPDSISEHYNKFVSESIQSCKQWNDGVVKRLLEDSGINENNSLAYLSYMQHYGVPTPFLDFTYNPYVALYIAIDDISFTPSENEIDNYFSLYYTYTDATAFKMWENVFDNRFNSQEIPYEQVAENEMSIILPSSEIYKVINNVNIINQKGLFLYNNHPWYPLEHQYKEFAAYVKKEMGEEKWDMLLLHDTIAGCFNIHKSLIPAIKKQLKSEGIDKKYVYPDMKDFTEQVSSEGILNCLTLKK